MSKLLLFIFFLPSILAQRGHYAGTRTQGYKDRFVAQTDDELANRFAASDPQATTQRLPVNAHGDRELVNRIAQMPRENQPFWYINANILEAQRNSPFPMVQGQSVQSGQGQLQQQQQQQQGVQGTNLNTRANELGTGGTFQQQQQPHRSPFTGHARH